MDNMGQAAQALPVQPLSIVVFGSFARGEADQASDIDAVLVRPGDVNEDDGARAASIEQWRSAVTRACGSHVEVLEVCSGELPRRPRGRAALWREIRRDGVVVHGPGLSALAQHAGGEIDTGSRFPQAARQRRRHGREGPRTAAAGEDRGRVRTRRHPGAGCHQGCRASPSVRCRSPPHGAPAGKPGERHRSQPAPLPESGRRDLNSRPPAPKAGALPGCATSRSHRL